MRDRFVQEAVEASCFTLVFTQFFGFLRGPNHLIQLLRIGGKLINEASSLLRINQQAFAPLFRLVMFAFVGIICMFQSIQLFSYRLRLNTPHQLTDKLHLSSSCLTPFGWDGSINLKRIKQFVLSELDFLKLLIRECRQFLSECLKCQHISFFGTFGWNLAGVCVDRFVIVMGAFVVHVFKV